MTIAPRHRYAYVSQSVQSARMPPRLRVKKARALEAGATASCMAASFRELHLQRGEEEQHDAQQQRGGRGQAVVARHDGEAGLVDVVDDHLRGRTGAAAGEHVDLV